jgi:hypothetical protein
MTTKSPNERECWVILTGAKNETLSQSIVPGQTGQWGGLDPFGSGGLSAGSLVYLARAGNAGGLLGHGIVQSIEAAELRGEAWATVAYSASFDPALSWAAFEQALASFVRQVRQSGAGSTDEWIRLADYDATILDMIVRLHGLPAPEIGGPPVSLHTVREVLPFSSSGHGILNEAAWLAFRGSNQPELLGANSLLDAFVRYGADGNPEHSYGFLVAFLNRNGNKNAQEQMKTLQDLGVSEQIEREASTIMLTEECVDILGQAARLAHQLWDRWGPVHASALFAAMLSHHPPDRPSEMLAKLQGWGIELHALLVAFRDNRYEYAPQTERKHWTAWFKRSARAGQEEAAPREIDFAFDADRPNGMNGDLVGIRQDVRAFSRFIAAANITTPLSIAIFGEWGAGKSFFVTCLQEQVGKLTDEARKAAVNGGSDYCARVVQIEFNAWHYAETNLWASLVHHILSQLHAALESQLKPKGEEKTLATLFDQLEAAKEGVRKAQADERQAKQEQQQAAQDLERARNASAEASADLSQLRALDVWHASMEELQKNEQLHNNLRRAAHRLGLAEVWTSGRELHRTASALRTTGGRLRMQLLSWLQAPHLAQRLALLVPVAICSVGAGPASEWLLQKINPSLQWTGFLQSLTSGLTLIVGGLGLLARHGSSISGAVGELMKMDATLQRQVVQCRKQYTGDVAAAEARLVSLEAEHEAAQMRLAEAERRHRTTMRALTEGTAAQRIRDYIEQRIGSGEYAEKLGIVSVIRRDFETLSDLFRANREQARDGRLDIVITETQKRIPYIDRIVLYIDDLDRCPADKVVDVLQAIHLLLAFDLFVVVVAVDPRWVSRSLRERYPHLLDEDHILASKAGEGRAYGHTMASSLDYLEKIFQIPFWVRPMDEAACRGLVSGLFKFDSRSTAAKQPQVDAGGDTGTDSAPGSIPDRKPAPSEASAFEGTLRPQDAPAEPSAASKAGPQWDPAAEPAEPFDPRPESLKLGQYERETMLALTPFVGNSPRRVKRFVNVYRVIKAGLPPAVHREFISNEAVEPGYRVAQAVQGLLTGAPSAAPLVLQHILRQPGGFPLKDLEPICATAQPKERRNLEGVLGVLAPEGFSEALLQALHRWAPLVMRYSFRYPDPASPPNVEEDRKPAAKRRTPRHAAAIRQ